MQWKKWCAAISVAEGEQRVRGCGSVTVRVLVTVSVRTRYDMTRYDDMLGYDVMA